MIENYPRGMEAWSAVAVKNSIDGKSIAIAVPGLLTALTTYQAIEFRRKLDEAIEEDIQYHKR